MCIFCKIAGKSLSAKVVYEDDKTMAFLDANPLSKGHTLVIPKEHYENIFDIPMDILQHLIAVAQAVAKELKKRLKADGINVLQSNGKAAHQEVMHFHLHLIPRYEGDGINAWPQSEYKEEDMNSVFELLK